MYKGVIFDLDGTLVDTLGDIEIAMNASLRAFGLSPFSTETYRAHIGGGTQAMVEALIASRWRTPVFNEFQTKIKALTSSTSRPFGGIEECIRLLIDKGVALAVVTNKYEAQAKDMIKRLLPDIPLNRVYGVTHEKWKKPCPTMTQMAMENLGTVPGNTLFIGDTRVDMETARAADMPAVFVDWGYGMQADLDLAPDHVVTDVSQLIQFVKNNC